MVQLWLCQEYPVLQTRVAPALEGMGCDGQRLGEASGTSLFAPDGLASQIQNWLAQSGGESALTEGEREALGTAAASLGWAASCGQTAHLLPRSMPPLTRLPSLARTASGADSLDRELEDRGLLPGGSSGSSQSSKEGAPGPLSLESFLSIESGGSGGVVSSSVVGGSDPIETVASATSLASVGSAGSARDPHERIGVEEEAPNPNPNPNPDPNPNWIGVEGEGESSSGGIFVTHHPNQAEALEELRGILAREGVLLAGGEP